MKTTHTYNRVLETEATIIGFLVFGKNEYKFVCCSQVDVDVDAFVRIPFHPKMYKISELCAAVCYCFGYEICYYLQ